VLVSSLGKALRSTVPALYHLTHRPYTTFPQEPVIAKVFEGIALLTEYLSQSWGSHVARLPTKSWALLAAALE